MINTIKKSKGFTLVELLLVMIIIGILAGMVMVTTGSATDKAEATKVISDLRTIKSDCVLFYADHDRWPVAAEDAKKVIPAGYSSSQATASGIKYSYELKTDSATGNISVIATRVADEKDVIGVEKQLAKMAGKVGLTTDGKPVDEDATNLYKNGATFGLSVVFRDTDTH